MIKLSITTKDTSVTVQDPRPVTQNNEEQAVISVEPNSTVSIIMQWGQLERLGSQLTDLAALGLCTFVVESTGGPAFTEQADAIDNPSIELVDAIAAAGTAGVVVTGYNLFAGQVQASASITGDTSAGSVLVKVLTPGYDGNDYDVEVVDSGSGGLATSSAVVSGRTVITVDLGGSAAETCTSVAADIATTLAGIVSAAAVGTGATPITAARAKTAFTGGVGTGLSVTLGGAACTITAVNLTGTPVELITITTPAVGSATDVARLRIRSDAKETFASITLG